MYIIRHMAIVSRSFHSYICGKKTNQTGGEELLQSKWPHSSINDDIAIRKKLSKMPLTKESELTAHTVLNANRKTRLRKQDEDWWDNKKETAVRI